MARAPRGVLRRIKIYGGALLVLLLLKVCWLFAFRTDAAKLLDGAERGDLEARRDYLLRRLLRDQATAKQMASPQGLFEGEWFAGTLSMTTAALTNLAFTYPDTRASAVEAIGRLVERAMAKEARAFDARMWRGEDALDSLDGPHGHAGYLGHLLLMLGAHRLVGGDARFEDLQGRIAASLDRRMRESPTAHLETYPGEIYAMDNAVVAAAVAVDGLARGVDHREPLSRWLELTRTRLIDPETGVIAFALDASGQRTQRSRGSGGGWNSFYLPFVDRDFARDQFARLREHFLASPLGVTGFREHRKGVDAGGDVDSGPVIFGLSPSGTGFAIAGARHARDAKLLGSLLDTAELAGFTFQWNGERRYLLAPLVGDAIVLAMKTACVWDRRYVP
jgi:hypothetical protein